jgi:hypothetical protein
MSERHTPTPAGRHPSDGKAAPGGTRQGPRRDDRKVLAPPVDAAAMGEPMVHSFEAHSMPTQDLIEVVRAELERLAVRNPARAGQILQLCARTEQLGSRWEELAHMGDDVSICDIHEMVSRVRDLKKRLAGVLSTTRA